MEDEAKKVVLGWVNAYLDNIAADIPMQHERPSNECIPKNAMLWWEPSDETDDRDYNEELHEVGSVVFAVFIRKDALNEAEFPQHESAFFAIVNRPEEEALVLAFYAPDVEEKHQITFSIDDNTAFANDDEVYQQIVAINNAWDSG
mgnify:CR=1 FL=1|tara:strand:- start:106 stop:543 length:438 start_codon:yes stop_codon:yes gene_type:complete